MKDEARGKKRVIRGVVVSDRMDKTITVSNDWRFRHPKYGKLIKKVTILKAHNEKNEAKTGDEVEIVETRPLSKTKRWRLLSIIKKGKVDNTLIEETAKKG
ncbi:MAG: 30S ribosomal protein S17 [Candidatus Brocadiia bacterium]